MAVSFWRGRNATGTPPRASGARGAARAAYSYGEVARLVAALAFVPGTWAAVASALAAAIVRCTCAGGVRLLCPRLRLSTAVATRRVAANAGSHATSASCTGERKDDRVSRLPAVSNGLRVEGMPSEDSGPTIGTRGRARYVLGVDRCRPSRDVRGVSQLSYVGYTSPPRSRASPSGALQRMIATPSSLRACLPPGVFLAHGVC